MKLLLALLLASSAWAVPTPTGNVDYKFTESAGSVAFPHTTQATTNPCMCAFIFQEASSSSSITSVVFGGTNFTKMTAVAAVSAGAGTMYGAAAYCMTGYSAGVLGNVTISASPNDAMAAFVQEFNGVNQTTIAGITGSLALANSASPSAITVTTQNVNSLVISLMVSGYIAQIPAMTPPAWTLLYQNSDDASRNNMAAYYVSVPTPGNVGSTWTWATNRYNTQLVFELNAVPTAATQPLSPPVWNINNSNMFPQQRQVMR